MKPSCPHLLAQLPFALLALLGCRQGPAGDAVSPPSGPPASQLPPDEPAEEPSRSEAPEDPEPAGDPALTVQVGSCYRAGCELTLEFGRPVFDGDPGTAPVPDLRFSPPQPGRWRWSDATHLRFQAGAGALLWGNSTTLTVPAIRTTTGEPPATSEAFAVAVEIPWFQVGGKVASWPVVHGEPRFVGFLNRFTLRLGTGPMLLLFDQPVDPAEIGSRVQVLQEGRRLATTSGRPDDVSHAVDEEVDLRHVVAVRVRVLPDSGEQVEVAVPSGRDTERYGLEVSAALGLEEPFFVDPWGDVVPAGRPVPIDARLVLPFANPVEAEQLHQALSLRPSGSMSVLGEWDSSQVALHLEPGRDHRLVLDAELTDVLGNRLGEDRVLTFRSADLAPELELPHLALSVERRSPQVELRGRNLTAIHTFVHRFSSPEAWAEAVAGPDPTGCAGLDGVGEPVLVGTTEHGGPPNTRDELALALPQAPTLACVEVRATGTGSEGGQLLTDAVLVQTTGLGLTAKVYDGHVFAWLTDLADADPIHGGVITVLDHQGLELGSGHTDGFGAAWVEVGDLPLSTRVPQPLFVVGRAGREEVVLHLEEGTLSQAWQFGLEGATPGPAALPAALFTERGAYRPGETAHAALLAGPDWGGASAVITVIDARGQELLRSAQALDRLGTTSLEIPLPRGAAVGRYELVAAVGEQSTRRSFLVEEYRVPTFTVGVDAPGTWEIGGSVDVEVRASYLQGGTLDARELTWDLVREPVDFRPEGWPRFQFFVADPTRVALAGSVGGGTARLDGTGRHAFSFTPTHPSSAGPVRYTVHADVTDVDRQNVAGRFSRVVHPAAFYVGLQAPATTVLDRGDRLTVPLIAVTPDGAVVPGVVVKARLERVDHHQTTRLASSRGRETGAAGGVPAVGGSSAGVQTLNRPVTVGGETCTTRTAAEPVTCTFTLPEAGAWQVRAWARDADGHDVSSGFGFTVAGEGPAAWPRFDREQIQVTADRASYRPGDLARLVVQTPFEVATGLLTVEADGVRTHRVFRIRGDTPALEVPITAELAPDAFVSVVLARGRVHDRRDATGFETGAPSFRIGVTRLKVETTEQRLAVEIAPALSVATPGETVAVDIHLRDPAGQLVEGQAAVMVVDEAVLALTAHRTPDPVPELHPDRPLGVRTADTRLDLPHARRARHEALFPSGDGSTAAGAALLPDARLRELFDSTAFFDGAVQVGAEGARVSIPLPDNTTTWRVMAVALDDRGRAGSGQEQIVARQPLMLQAVLPRFAYQGDQLPVQAIVHNGTPADGLVTVQLETGGLELAGDAVAAGVPVRAGGTATVSFPVSVVLAAQGRGAQASVRLSARMGAHQDAVQVALPILEPGVHRTQVLSQSVPEATTLALTLPEDRVRGTERLEVVASTTALTELKDAVGYLMDYPNGCIEQTTSRAYPLVVLEDLLGEIGVDVDRARLHEYAEAGVARILSFQTEAGGLSYWPGGTEPHAFATSFGLTALIEARKRGYDVPDEALARMADYLEEALKRGDVTESIPHGSIADGDTRALFALTLGRLGRPQPAVISHLWEERAKLTPFGLSFLAIAAAEADPHHPLLPPILAAVRKAAEEDASQAWFEGDPRGGYSLDSPLRSHASALLAYATAKDATGQNGAGANDAGAKGHDEMGGKLLQGLLARRQGGLWGNTQENVFGVMGVHALTRRGAGGSGPRVTLSRNGVPIDPGSLEEVSPRVRRLRLGADQLGADQAGGSRQEVSLSNQGGTPAILTVRADYDVALTPENRAPRGRGASIERVVETLEGQPLHDVLPLGSVVRVRLRVHTDAAQNYVAIDDKLPAGLEPLNAALATTQRVAMGELTPAVSRGLEVLSYQEIRDHRVAFYADALPAGEVELQYVARATTPGTFLRPAAGVEAMYDPSVVASTAIDTVVIR